MRSRGVPSFETFRPWSGAAAAERLVIPQMSQQGNALSLASIALGLVVAGAIVPDLLVRMTPDRELIDRRLQPSREQVRMSWP
ncbi:MAG TPA: hypothetical protein VKB87_00105 [Myxococcaceae bacterium]|nr:hypothetical protein [Myxococcaceae bacterium]